jgi:hypothetical protein
MIRAGQEVTIVLAGQGPIFTVQPSRVDRRPCQLISDAMIRAADPVRVRSCNSIETINFSYLYDYTATLVVSALTSFASAEDLARLIAGRAYDGIGYYPAEIAVTNVGGIPTGSAQPANPEPGVIDSIAATFGNLGEFLAQLSGSLWLVLLVVVVAVVIILSTDTGRTAALAFI